MTSSSDPVQMIEDASLWACIEAVGKAQDARYEAQQERDEALVRCDELERERDQARRIAASLYEEVAKVRELHRPVQTAHGEACIECQESGGYLPWPCSTAAAVYLTAEAVKS